MRGRRLVQVLLPLAVLALIAPYAAVYLYGGAFTFEDGLAFVETPGIVGYSNCDALNCTHFGPEDRETLRGIVFEVQLFGDQWEDGTWGVQGNVSEPNGVLFAFALRDVSSSNATWTTPDLTAGIRVTSPTSGLPSCNGQYCNVELSWVSFELLVAQVYPYMAGWELLGLLLLDIAGIGLCTVVLLRTWERKRKLPPRPVDYSSTAAGGTPPPETKDRPPGR